MLPIANRQDVDALQNFAITMAIAFPVIFMLLLPWFFNTVIPLWPAVVTLVLMLLYIVKPLWLYAPYWLWMVFASIMGWFNTKIILAIAYCLLIVPTGLIMRALKKLQYRNVNTEHSAWVKRDTKPTKDNLKEPF